MLKRRNQKGFTLIEIIAVLIILGILAAVAIPRYFSMQDEARNAAIQGAIAAASSNLSMSYAKYLLTGGQNATLANLQTVSKDYTLTGDLGDFTAGYTSGTGASCSVTITITQKEGGASWVTAYAGTKTKDVGCPWAP